MHFYGLHMENDVGGIAASVHTGMYTRRFSRALLVLHLAPTFKIEEAPCWNLFVRIPTKSRTANRRKKKEERKNRRGETTSRVYRLLRYPPLMYPLLAGTYPVPATAGTTTRAVHCASHIPTRDCVKLSRLCDVNVCDPPSRIPTRGFSPEKNDSCTSGVAVSVCTRYIQRVHTQFPLPREPPRRALCIFIHTQRGLRQSVEIMRRQRV